MKKKGLIISTVVMVVVLIASLTTATFAWFTQSATATIDSIAFQVGAGADLLIRVSGTNDFVASPTNAAFYSGSTTYTQGSTFNAQGKWEGDVNALGVNIDLNNLNLSNISKAVGTGTFTGNPGSWQAVHSFHNKTNLVGFAKTYEHRKHFFLVLVGAEILRFASQIIESKIGKHVQRIVIFAKCRRANLVAELAQTIVSCSAVFVQFCQRRYEKRNHQTALFVAQIFERIDKQIKIFVVFQKTSGQRQIVGDVGDKEIFLHNKVVIDKFFKSDNIEFVDAHRAFRDIKIIANAHSAEITIVQNLKRIDKRNLFRLARSVCHSAEEEIDRFV